MKNNIIISKMLGHIEKIKQYTKGMTYETFIENSLILEASVFNLLQIGELANKMDDEFKVAHPEIAWHKIYGLRNRIIHDYEGVRFDLVWQVITEDLPDLESKLRRL